jgi:ligand-binding SRPBCC domain-containing protein
MPKIELQIKIKADKKIVFDLSRSIDLHKISTKHTNEEAISGRISGMIELNESVTWSAKHFGVYQLLTSKITEFDSPHYFTDEMEKGAFKWFEHKHIFEDIENGTLMTDIFEYKSPFGIFGKIADTLFLRNYIKNLLEKRNETIKEYAESEKWKTIVNP